MTEADQQKPSEEQDTTPASAGGGESTTAVTTEPAAAGGAEPPADGGSAPVAAGDPAAPADEAEAAPGPRPGRRALVTGIVVGALGIVVAVLAVTAFAWPGFLAGPGSPDAEADRAITALSTQDGAALDQLTCHGQDGTAISQLPPQLLQAITAVDRTGPTTLLLDTQAQAPVTVSLEAQGQSQDVPAGLLLGVTDGEWCFGGLSQGQTG
jgi:hypothetical protein